MTEDVEVKQANYEGWSIVEMMGHRKEIGYVTTQAFGPAVLFRVDTPELPEREFTLTRPEYATGETSTRLWCPAGTKVKRPAVPARSALVSPNSLYCMTPCSEEAARTAIEHNIERPLIILELPAQPALTAPDDRTFTCCGGNPEDGHADHCTEADEDDDDEEGGLHSRVRAGY